MAARRIARSWTDPERKDTVFYSEDGREFSTPKGFRHPLAKIGAVVDEDDVAEVVAAVQAWNATARERAAERREKWRAKDAARPQEGVVTDLAPSSHGKVEVHIGGEYALSALSSAISAFGVEVGSTLSRDTVARLKAGAAAGAAARILERFCSYRPRSVKEAHDRLARVGFDEVSIGAAIAERLGEDVLDDATFARWYARRNAYRGKGAGDMAFALRRLGVEDAASEAAEEGFDTDMAVERASRAAAGGLDLSEWKDRSKFFARMARRGLMSEASGALDKLVAAKEAADPGTAPEPPEHDGGGDAPRSFPIRRPLRRSGLWRAHRPLA